MTTERGLERGIWANARRPINLLVATCFALYKAKGSLISATLKPRVL